VDETVEVEPKDNSVLDSFSGLKVDLVVREDFFQLKNVSFNSGNDI